MRQALLRRLGRPLRRVSGGGLLLALLTMSTLVAIGLSASVLAGASRSNEALAESIELGLLGLLERSGVSGLVAEIDRLDGALVPGQSRVEFAVWRRARETQTLLRETAPGFGALALRVAPPEPQTQTWKGRRYALYAPDVADASMSWDLPTTDVDVRYAIALPTPQTRSARRALIAVWSGFAIALVIGLVLHRDYRVRYRNGLDQVNALLDDFAAGNTSAAVSLDAEVPELRRLNAHLQVVLPRFDRLIGDLRALSAHLAHELRTPLQAIRTDVSRMSLADTLAERRTLSREIDTTIDVADARLRSVMELFRLSSDGEVEMVTGLALAPLVLDRIYDFEEILVARNRTLQHALDDAVMVIGNAPLLELLVGNLLSNAAKYAPEGADIGIALRHREGSFELCISNTGSAFPEDMIGRPFERLARAREHRDIQGYGLGLALVDVIARRHGFTATLSNTAGSGADATLASVTLSGPCA
ncbi:MAG: HAMP domain-containing sensor histidine kinase [Pseudomonadota bacterium]